MTLKTVEKRRDRRNAMVETVTTGKTRKENEEKKKKTAKTLKFLQTELRNCDLLSPLTGDQILAMAKEMKIREFDSNKFIIKLGLSFSFLSVCSLDLVISRTSCVLNLVV